MEEYHFSTLVLTVGGYGANVQRRQTLSFQTTKNASDDAQILIQIEVVDSITRGGDSAKGQNPFLQNGDSPERNTEEKEITVEYLDEKQVIELYHYVKSCLCVKYPNI